MPLFRKKHSGSDNGEERDKGSDLDGLQEFARRTDRSRPLHFAGREPEFEFIRSALKQVCDPKEGGDAGATQLITAAPGAGKTALLRELEERWSRKTTKTRVVRLNPGDFDDPALAMREFLKQLDAAAARKAAAVTTETESDDVRTKAGVAGLIQVEGGGQAWRAVQRAERPVKFSQAFELLTDRKTPVVVLVDEAQKWGADCVVDGVPTSKLLMEAHQNEARLPLLIVAAGLGDLEESLRNRGLSRLATRKSIHVLGPLSEDEMREVVEVFFDRFGVEGDAEQRTAWTEAILADTCGWPRHLTNALFGAAEAIHAGGGDLAESSLDETRGIAAAYRQEYYEKSVRPLVAMPQLLSAVFTAMDPASGATEYALKKAIRQAYETDPDLNEEMERGEAYTELLHQGLIQDRGGDRYDCPISSLRRYVEEFCRARGYSVNPWAQEAAHGRIG